VLLSAVEWSIVMLSNVKFSKGENKMKKYLVKIKGIRPVMHSKYDLEEEQRKQRKVKGQAFNAKEDAEKCLYRDANGKVYQPADHIEGALIKTGSKFPIPGAGKKTYKDRMKSEVFISPQQIPFPNGEKYEVDIRSGVIPATRGRVPIARPRWDDWEFEFNISADEKLVPGSVLKDILTEAGRTQGIGTFRPKFGLFEVTEFQLI
jgi:hypothetical protein